MAPLWENPWCYDTKLIWEKSPQRGADQSDFKLETAVPDATTSGDSPS